jgi:hypothetical protein
MEYQEIIEIVGFNNMNYKEPICIYAIEESYPFGIIEYIPKNTQLILFNSQRPIQI